VSARAGNAEPSAAPETTHHTHSITTTTAGRLYVMGRGRLSIDCTAGSAVTGLCVNGTAVPASGSTYPANTTTEVVVFGVTAPLAAGIHSVALRTGCDGGDWEVTTFSNVTAGAILLGGS